MRNRLSYCRGEAEFLLRKEDEEVRTQFRIARAAQENSAKTISLTGLSPLSNKFSTF